MKLLIYTAATKDYHYATEAQVRNLKKAVALASDRITEAKFLLIGDPDKALQSPFDGVEINGVKLTTEGIEMKAPTSKEPYQNEFQLFVSRMRQAAVDYACCWGAHLVWSLDADVLPKPNSLRCMLDTVQFDGGELYQVAFCPYPSQGGGPFMGGRGTVRNHILPDFYEDECDIPESLLNKRKRIGNKLGKNPVGALLKKLRTEMKSVHRKIRGCRPKGNVFEMNGKKWRQRGWCDYAYPALGFGAIVPFDWSGSGCTLMTQRAYMLCDWTGYKGEGTEDLYVIWRRWYPAGIRIGGVLHCPADHVIRSRDPKEKGKLIHIVTGHETEGEMVHHLRKQYRPWYGQVEGDSYDAKNDGDPNPVARKTARKAAKKRSTGYQSRRTMESG